MFTIDFSNRLLIMDHGIQYSLNGLAIVVSPHQDDESIGMGGTIALLIKHGFTVHYVFTTIESTDEAVFRKFEAEAAISQLGIADSKIYYLDLVDGDSKSFTLNFSESVGRVKNQIREIELRNKVIEVEENGKEVIIDNKHTIILTTSRHDAHRDHEETFNMIKNGTRKKIILEFPVVNHMSSAFTFNSLIEIPDDVYETKKNALFQYVGEDIKGRIMWDDIEAFMLENGKLIGRKRAESCFVSWYGYLKPLNKLI